MRIGNVGLSWSFTKHPFSLFLRTTYFVMGDPLEGPQYVRQLTHWLWGIVSWNAGQKKLDEAKEMWASEANAPTRAKIRAEFERHQKETGNVTRIH